MTLTPGLTDEDGLLRTSADGQSVLTCRVEIPLRLESVDLESGSRTPFREIAPADRLGLWFISPPFVSDDGNSYAYGATWLKSRLFSVRWGR